MRIALWDTDRNGVSKDFAGGFGIGVHPGTGGIRGRMVRWFHTRDRRPTALLFAHLAAIFQDLGHEVVYRKDRFDHRADLHVFFPALMTLEYEREQMQRLLKIRPDARIFVVGPAASTMPEYFEDMEVTVVRGDAEQLLWCFDRVMDNPGMNVNLGSLEDLDSIPYPDWSPFGPRKFKLAFDFYRFPTAMIHASRGCTHRCDYCPYIALEQGVRTRDPEAVVEEIRYGVRNWGFRSFKFRDPLFGHDRENMYRLADLIGRMKEKIEFSVESHIEILKPEVLRLLKRVGLTSVTIGLERPDDDLLRSHRRAQSRKDRQHEFLEMTRKLGIRTVGEFLVGMPDDTEEAIRRVWQYAIDLGPTFAAFNVVTPYPGTPFFEQMRPQIEDLDFSHYTAFHPIMKYEHLSTERFIELHAKAYHRFYFRWDYLRQQGPLLFPMLRWLGLGRKASSSEEEADDSSSTAESVLASRGMRLDAPHRRTSSADKRADHKTTE